MSGKSGESEVQQRLKSVFEAVEGIPVQGYDADRKVVFWNPASERLYGYSRDEALGERLEDLIVPDEMREEVIEHIRNWHDNDIPIPSGELELRHKNGEPLLVYSNHVMITNPLGKREMFCIDIDLTEMHQTQSRVASLAAVVENSDNIVVVKDLDLQVVATNPAYAAAAGHATIETMIGKTDAEIFGVSPETEPIRSYMADERFAQTLPPGESILREEPLITGTGEKRIVLTKKYPVYDRSGILIGTGNISTDITELKQAEQALRESEQRLSLATRSAGIGIWEWNVVDNTMIWDEQIYRLYGLSDPTVVYSVESWNDLLHPDDREMAWNACQAALQGEADYDLEFRVHWPDGTLRWLKADGMVVRDEDGQPIRMIGTNYDITERKTFQQEIEALEMRNRALLDHSPVCHKIIDLDFKLQYMNANGFKMLKLELSNEWYGQPYPFSFFQEASRQELSACLQQVKDSGQVVTLELPACDREGNEIRLHHSLIPVFNHEGALEYITVVSADITEQQQMQERIRQTQKMDAIGQLAGGVAHDFNNQLAGVMGYADMLRERLEDPELKRYADNILVSARRSSDLTKKLLAFSRQGQYETIPVDMHSIINEVVDILSHSIDKKVNIQQLLRASTAYTRGDPSQIQNALLNLAINAADAMPEGGDLVFDTSVSTLSEEDCGLLGIDAAPGPFLRVCVIDNGTGIPKELQSRIFEPFFTTKEVGKGTGMGLASVFGTVKAMGGAIDLYSEIGHGSTFRLYLPLAQLSEKVTPQAETTQTTRKNALILVIDDEEGFRNMATDLLTSLQYQVHVENDGVAGVEYFRKHHQQVDLVILDMVMPRMNGEETHHALKAIQPDVKVLLASGYNLNGTAQGLRADTVGGFIQKPFDRSELSVKVAEAL